MVAGLEHTGCGGSNCPKKSKEQCGRREPTTSVQLPKARKTKEKYHNKWINDSHQRINLLSVALLVGHGRMHLTLPMSPSGSLSLIFKDYHGIICDHLD